MREGGALVEMRFPLHINSLHDLRLTLGEQSVVLKGRVTHCHISDVDQDASRIKPGWSLEPSGRRIARVIAEFLDTLEPRRRSA